MIVDWKRRVRRVSRAVLQTCMAAVVLGPTAASADLYPNRPIRMIVPIAAGGGTDIIARVVGLGLTQSFGQQVIIDNRAGAGGVIGMRLAAQQITDLVMSAAVTSTPAAFRQFIEAEITRWRHVITKTGMQAE